MGPVITAQHRDRVAESRRRAAKRKARKSSATAAACEVADAPNGFFLGATIVDQVQNEMTLAREEVFGPVLNVMRMDDLDHAIELANKSAYGNGAAIFTNSGKAAREFKHRVKAGMVGINVGVPATMAMFPFTGWDDSFYGDLHIQGKEGVQFYTQQKVSPRAGLAKASATSGRSSDMSLLIKERRNRHRRASATSPISFAKAKRSPGSIAISLRLRDAEVIDATGKYVFPGFIDPHVHIYLPFMGTFAKDTHETASRAALVGGTTTFIEMICPGCEEKPLEAFELWLGKARGASACDFTFHMGVTRFDDEAERDFREIVRRGVSSFKVFLAYKGAFGVSDEQLYKTLALAKALGVITTAHCENADLVAELQKKLLGEGKTGPGMALLEPAAGGGSGRRASSDDLRRDDRRACLHRAPELRRSAARSDPRRGSAACTSGSRR